MEDLKLDLDEGIILQTTDVERYQKNDNYIEVYELYLTNKNLISVYEKSNGMFKKSEMIVEKIPLTDIKVVNGKVQIFKKDDNDYGLGLQILFTNGTREHFVFCNNKKELQIWIDSIIEAIIGEKPLIIKNEKEVNKVGEATAGFMTGLKKVVDSAKEIVEDIKTQVVDEYINKSENKENEIDEIKEKTGENQQELDDEIIKEEKKESKMSNENEKYIYCSNCGEKLSAKSKFCNICGNSINKTDVIAEEQEIKIEEQTEREKVYDGKIHKCPSCGEELKAFDIKCPSCGFEIRDRNSSSSLREFSLKLEKIESGREKKKATSIFAQSLTGDNLSKTDEQKISLIRSFIIPNTKEDLYEFLILSKSNIEIDLYENTQLKTARLAVSDAWKAKFEQAYQKAKLLFKNDERMIEIQAMYDEVNKSIEKAKWKTWKTVGITFGVIILMYVFIFGMIALTGGFDSDDNTSNNSDSKNNSSIINENTKDDNESTTDSNKEVSFEKNIVATSNKHIEIKEVGYTMVGDYLTCIVTIKNTNSKKAIEYPSFRVTVYDENGKILGSEERVLSILYPNQEMVDQGTLIEVSEEPAKIEITALGPDEDDLMSVSSLEHPDYKEMKCQNLSVNSDKITGEVYNPNDYKIESAMITVVFRNSKKEIVASESAFIDDIPANGKVPFDISLADDAKTTDKIEAFAYIW